MAKVNVEIRLRRDNENNYNLVKDTFIPKNGEVCLVDGASDAEKVYSYLRAKVGDGVKTFAQLPYVDNAVFAEFYLVYGYANGNKFYRNYDGTTFSGEYTLNSLGLYIDKRQNVIFHYDSDSGTLIQINKIPAANASTAGIAKLYTTVGGENDTNTDGGVTQAAITNALRTSYKIELKDNEVLEFSGLFNIVTPE